MGFNTLHQPDATLVTPKKIALLHGTSTLGDGNARSDFPLPVFLENLTSVATHLQVTCHRENFNPRFKLKSAAGAS
jgi:hypothetical protein